ncbi:sigma-70 family RNA polymerase sigma factor [Vagococcus xieshaowenii]|uniref:Sigma-70 family RNA polymerase sigma factor n=1 Tax=Vagococcus xieshaowenii TaxID=2562451 RepID=A0AAJ5JR02_9ENTE|nr:sigma-70 family RNA polymerase sigma factor [Vagococcus xieshaowenii]QCA29246.1 sigma-70 family RNA polymerase sigma factor [Vagococcus xieshaowenii]TFZ43242.1 sigma-70 family RNA polymerase sigma factor [Vagococcus xieshaowenii]
MNTHLTEYFDHYEPMIYGVLKSLTIHRYHPHYEDLVQTSRLLLWELLVQTDDLPQTEQERYQLGGYLYQRIRWRIIDLLRRDNQYAGHVDIYNPIEEMTEVTDLPSRPEIPSVEYLLTHEWQQLPPHLRTYLIATVDYQLTITEIAKNLNVSRQTLYTWRKQLQQHLNNWQTT